MNRRSFLPRHAGCTEAEAPAEPMAEAIRAYIVDPNAMKTAYPPTAERICGAVNEHPTPSPVVQFSAEGVPMPFGFRAPPSGERLPDGLPVSGGPGSPKVDALLRAVMDGVAADVEAIRDCAFRVRSGSPPSPSVARILHPPSGAPRGAPFVGSGGWLSAS